MKPIKTGVLLYFLLKQIETNGQSFPVREKILKIQNHSFSLVGGLLFGGSKENRQSLPSTRCSGSRRRFSRLLCRHQSGGKKLSVILVDKSSVGRSDCSPFAAGAINICYRDDDITYC